MAEDSMGSCPQVFVVDSKVAYIPSPGAKKARWATSGQKCLLLLVAMALTGLIVEGCFIYRLYKKTEDLCPKSDPLCQNALGFKAPAQQFDSEIAKGHPVTEGSTRQTPPEQSQRVPFAQLMGFNTSFTAGEVVPWKGEDAEANIHQMGYSNGRLRIKKKGYYYLFSKLQMNVVEECAMVLHKVMKLTRAYDRPIELMKSESNRCLTSRPSGMKMRSGEDLWDSFQAGIFQLDQEDEIYVTVDDRNIRKLRAGASRNFMGAFMISS